MVGAVVLCEIRGPPVRAACDPWTWACLVRTHNSYQCNESASRSWRRVELGLEGQPGKTKRCGGQTEETSEN